MAMRNTESPAVDKLKEKFSRPPIIIAGCARSGTTLLLSVLSAHPNIYGIPFESRAFCGGFYDGSNSPDCPFDLTPISEHFQTVSVPKNGRWCEKTPRNIQRIKAILEYFNGEVKILNIVRDGRDVILSRHPENSNIFWVTPQRWIEDVQAGLQWERIPQMLTLRYEDLVMDFERTIGRICEFLDEEVTPEILSWNKCTKIKEHEAWFEKAQPIHDRSIGIWKQATYRRRIEELMKMPQAVSLLKHYGYEL
jgi:hypothetical protein